MENTINNTQVKERNRATFLGRTLLWMGYGLVLTFVTAFLVPFIMQNVMGGLTDDFALALYVMCGVGAVGVLVMSIICMIKSFSMRGFGPILYTLYALFMGLALSPLWLLFLTPEGAIAILYTLLVTGGIFGILGVIGYFAGDKVKFLPLMAIGLAIGLMITSLFNWLFFGNQIVNLLIQFGIIALIMIYIVIDFAIISKFKGEIVERNVAIMCAFNLYTDFIILFIRLLPFILRMVGDRS